jgi:hypothetical protein
MLSTIVWEFPEKIEDFCAILAKLYDIRGKAMNSLIMETSERYLLKYSNDLVELVMAVIDGKIHSNNISLDNALNISNNIPATIIGKVLQTLVKAFRVTIALKDNEKRISSSMLLLEALDQYLDMIIALIKGGEINYNIIYDRLDEIEAKLKEFKKSNG